jgi:protein tyrosine/serine phosphatase
MNLEINSMPIDDSYWVIPGRFRAGEYPGSIQEDKARSKLRWLLNQDINVILDLTMAGEAGLKPYVHFLHEEATTISILVIHKRLSIQDLSKPSQEKMVEILDTIDSALSEGKNIYLHCYGGKGRTGTVVGCYLVRHGTPRDKALEKIQELRREIPGKSEQSPETEGQRKMVMEWTKGR